MLKTDAADVNVGVAKVGCCLLLDLLFVSDSFSARGCGGCQISAAAAVPLQGAGSVPHMSQIAFQQEIALS